MPVSSLPHQAIPMQPNLASNLPPPSSQMTPVSPLKSQLNYSAPAFVPKKKTPLAIIDPKTQQPVDISAPVVSTGPAQNTYVQQNPIDLEKQKQEERQKEELRLKEKAEKEEKERIERERQEKEEKERKEREERERIEREAREKEERDRQERESREKEEKERQERTRQEQEEKERNEREQREKEETEAREKEEQKRREEANQQKEEIEEEDEDLDGEDANEYSESTSSEQEADKLSSDPQMNTSGGKKMYSREFLLGFQNLCRDRPDSLPMVEAIVGIDERSSGNGVLGNPPRGANMTRGRPGGAGQRNSGFGGRGGKMAPNARGPPLKPRSPWGAKNEDDPLFKLKRTTTSLLNKITVEKFEEISNQILNVGITSAQILDEVIGLSFQKAILEPHFANLYAELCVKLSKQCASFDDPENPTKKITFKRILLNRCQDEFEKKRKEEAAKETAECKTEEEREEARFKQRRRMMGNIKFIGELYNRNLLPSSVVANSIVPKLLHADSEPEELECLCKFMKTSGKVLESTCYTGTPPKPGPALAKLNEYFDMIKSFADDPKYDSRIRFMLQDIIELRQNNWVPRREEKTAKKIKEIHQEAEEEEIVNASLPIVNQPAPANYQNKFRRNDSGRGSPASGNHYEKSRDNSSRVQVSAKQPAQSASSSAYKSQQTPNLRPNGGKVWGKPDPSEGSQKPSSKDNRQPAKSPASVSVEVPSQPAEPITLEAWEDLISPIYEEVFVSLEVAETAKDFKQQLAKAQQSGRELQAHLVHTGCLKALDSGAGSAGCLVNVLTELLRTEVINMTDLEQGLIKTREQLGELKLDIPHAPSDFCQVISLLFSAESLDFTFFQKLYPLDDSDLEPREAFVQMLLALSKKNAASVNRLFDSKLPITSYFPTADDLLTRLVKMNAFSVFGKLPWEKTYAKDIKSGQVLVWFTENQTQIELENSEAVSKFMKIFLIRVTRDSTVPQKSAWGKVDQTKKPEQEVIDANAKLLSALLTSDLQVDALEAMQGFSEAGDKGLIERILPSFFDKKIFSVDSLSNFIDSKGDSLDPKLKQFLNSLKGEILSKAS